METIRNRVKQARHQLQQALENLGTPGDWSFITKQVGVASLTGLNGECDFFSSEILGFQSYFTKS